MSKSLVKVIDVALLPAALMVVSKLIGIFISAALFEIEIDISSAAESILSIRPVVESADLSALSTYSDLIMYLLLASGFTFILVQATHFHDTHINPRLLVKLNKHNLTGLVQSSFKIYHSAAIWSIVLWIATILVLVNAVVGATQWWVGITSIFASIIFSTLMIQDVYREIELGQRQIGKSQALS